MHFLIINEIKYFNNSHNSFIAITLSGINDNYYEAIAEFAIFWTDGRF